MRGRWRSLSTAALLLSIAVCVFAQDTETEESIEPWTVSFAQWTTRALGDTYRPLRFSLPLTLRDRLQDIEERLLSEQERERLRARERAEAAEELYEDLRDVEEERDDLLYEDLTRRELRSRLEELAEEEAELLQEMELPPSTAARTAERVPLEFSLEELREPPAFSPREAAIRLDVDLLVWGELEEIEGFIFWRVGCHSRLLDREIFLREGAASPSRVLEEVEGLIGELAEAILGRPWARIVVDPMPEDALVRIDGRSLGTGRVELRFATVGEHVIEVDSPGFRSRVETIDVQAGESRLVAVPLEMRTARPVTVTTEPSGAAIYLESTWVGQSPVVLSVSPELVRGLMARKEGYYDAHYTLSYDAPSQLELELRKQIVDPAQWQEQKRRTFYRSLGMFALSVPVGIVFWAGATDAFQARNNAPNGSDEWRRLDDRAKLLTYGWAASVFASSMLFLNMAGDLAGYIRYADEPAY